ncbi:ester cyclase [Litoribaculum gwangyangense]|uniref:SnoaL-like domain-containing protein n=1 Tax=Litoribaculum gwangyangense TaxID=1130722 RepID=A0ABP9CTB6_9FLAO
MKHFITLLFIATTLFLTSCKDPTVEKNIKVYTNTWDEIVNQGKLDLINESNFSTDITMISQPENIVGIEDFKAYYSNFITGFSDIKFTVLDVLGQGDQVVKHWKFEGKHTGDFFGIPATGKSVNVEGATIAKMKDGKILQEQDFMDNLIFMEQLGIDPYLNPNNIMVIQKIYNDFEKGDIPAVGEAIAENAIWNEAENFPLADGNPYIGFEAILNGVFARIGSEWEYWKLTDLNLQEMTNNKILATGRYQAKYKKNGAEINLQMAHLWTLENGKVIQFQQFADTKGIADAMNK